MRRPQLAAYVVVVAAFVGSNMLTEHRFDQAIAAVHDQRALDRAQACVSAWEGRLGVRSLIEALVSASSNADPERVAAFREDVAERLPDPACDLEAARRRVALDQEES